MQNINLTALNFHNQYPEAHHVSITSVSSCTVGYLVLLNIWRTEDYKSIQQELVYLISNNIISQHSVPDKRIWTCVYALDNDKYILGSKSSEDDVYARLTYFEKENEIWSRAFNKGFSTNILKVSPNIDSTLLVHGEYYVLEKAGSHDEYWPRWWTHQVTKDGKDAEVKEVPLNYICLADYLNDPNSEKGDYYLRRKNLLAKFCKSHEKLWEQDVAISVEEKRTNISQLAPYYRMQGEKYLNDGVWVAGSKVKANKSMVQGRSLPFLYRVSSGGSIVRFKDLFDEFPDLQSARCIIPGRDNDCFLLGETLKVGQGNGLYLMHVELRPRAAIKALKYFNFQQENQIVPGDMPEYSGTYITAHEIHSITGKNGDLRQFHIFINVSNYDMDIRDNGIKVIFDFQGYS